MEGIMSEIFRVEKSKNFTIMSNFHLKDKRLTLKAKGLLSQILSLPEDWDYTLAGLAYINIEHRETIGKAVKELIEAGYIIRSQVRDENGKLGKSSYVIYEDPNENPQFSPQTEKPSTVNPITVKPSTVKPQTENPTTVKPCTEKPPQSNNVYNPKSKKSRTKKSRTDFNNHSINQTLTAATPKTDGLIDGLQNQAVSDLPNLSYYVYLERIKANIDYDMITDLDNRQIKDKDDVERIDEIIEVMVDMLYPETPLVRIGKSEFPHEVVKSRLYKITSEHIIYIIDSISRNTTKIKNMAAYLRKTVYNAPTTYNNYVTADVNNMLHGG
jgi:hypothetical protein